LGNKRTIDFQGRKVQAEEVAFESGVENWTQYTLEDGTILKMKGILLEVVRLSEYNEKGEPIYQFSAQQIVGTIVPDKLKKKPV